MRAPSMLLALTLAAAAGAATAAPITLGFDDPANWDLRLNDPTVTGLPVGVSFTANAWAVGSSLSAKGCSDGSLLFVPRDGCGALILSADINSPTNEETESFTINVAQGFADALNFSYSTYKGNSNSGANLTVDVLDANGVSLLGQAKKLPETAQCINAVNFCTWSDAGLKFSGIAKSIVFSGNSDLALIDSIKFNSVDGVPNKAPEPTGLGLLAAALAAAATARRRNKR